MGRDVLDQIRYVVLGTIDDDGRPRVSPVYFTAHRYADLYWVSHPGTHHSINLARDNRATGVVYDSTVAPQALARSTWQATPVRSLPTSWRSTARWRSTRGVVAEPSPRRN